MLSQVLMGDEARGEYYFVSAVCDILERDKWPVCFIFYIKVYFILLCCNVQYWSPNLYWSNTELPSAKQRNPQVVRIQPLSFVDGISMWQIFNETHFCCELWKMVAFSAYIYINPLSLYIYIYHVRCITPILTWSMSILGIENMLFYNL